MGHRRLRKVRVMSLRSKLWLLLPPLRTGLVLPLLLPRRMMPLLRLHGLLRLRRVRMLQLVPDVLMQVL